MGTEAAMGFGLTVVKCHHFVKRSLLPVTPNHQARNPPRIRIPLIGFATSRTAAPKMKEPTANATVSSKIPIANRSGLLAEGVDACLILCHKYKYRATGTTAGERPVMLTTGVKKGLAVGLTGYCTAKKRKSGTIIKTGNNKSVLHSRPRNAAMLKHIRPMNVKTIVAYV